MSATRGQHFLWLKVVVRRTMFEISALTLRLPIEVPDPAWLHTRFSIRAWLDGLFTDTHSSRFVTFALSVEFMPVVRLTPCLVIVDPVVLTDGVNTIVASKAGASDRQVVDLDILRKVEHKVELRAIHEDEVVNASIGRRDNADQSRSLSAWSSQRRTLNR